MLVTYKFFKRVILIKDKNTFTAEEWAHAFLARLDFINWGLPGELIIDQDPKFLSKFWASPFKKLGICFIAQLTIRKQIAPMRE